MARVWGGLSWLKRAMDGGKSAGEGAAEVLPAGVLKDRRGRRYGLVREQVGDRYLLRLYDGRCCVGEVRCRLVSGPGDDGSGANGLMGDGPVMLLDDVGVANEVLPVPRPWDWILGWWWEPEPVSYRGRGLGTALVEVAIAQAVDLGAVALVGEVFQPDVENTPGLLDWYGRLGFGQRPPRPGAVDQVAEIYLDLRLWASARSSSIQ